MFLKAFMDACDRSGLYVPGNYELIKELLQADYFADEPETWPPKPLYKALAFAQHHGVPTCLLDWSKRAHVAAYFAASSALQASRGANENSKTRHFAVWALKQLPDHTDIVETAGSVSPNLAAQSGVFTISRVRGKSKQEFIPDRLEIQTPPEGHFELKQMTISIDHAAEVMEKCAMLGVSGSTMFPGYEGIAKSVRDWAGREYKDFDPDEIALRDLI